MRRTALASCPPLEPSLRGAVDVVMPVRNGASTILPALKSVLDQTIVPRRIIVVDDGSTDDTVRLVAKIGSDLVQVVSSPPVGVSHARNTGIEASRAEFVAFLDADDRWHPDKLRRQLQVFAADPKAAVVYCGYSLLQPSGAVVSVQPPTLRGFVFNELLAGEFGGNSSSAIVRREALLQIGGYDEALSFGEDTDLQLHLARRHEFNFADGILTYLINNPDSTMRRPIGSETQMEVLLQYIVVFEKWCPENTMPRSRARRVRRQIAFIAMRRQYGLRWMLRLRAKLLHLAPLCGRRIWPSHAVFFGYVAWATLAYPFRLLARNALRTIAPMMRPRPLSRFKFQTAKFHPPRT